MITLHNPGIVDTVKKTVSLKGESVGGGPRQGGLAQFSTWKATGAGLGGFYLSRVITKLVDRNVIANIEAVQGRSISRLVLATLGILGSRMAGIVVDGMSPRDGTGNAVALGGMLGILQGVVMPAILPEGSVKEYLAAPSDWGGDLSVIPGQPLAGAYETEWNPLGQPYYEGLGEADLRSEYDNAQLDAGDDEEAYFSY